jgi:hypothetical protein
MEGNPPEISALYRMNPDSASRIYQTILNGDYEKHRDRAALPLDQPGRGEP